MKQYTITNLKETQGGKTMKVKGTALIEILKMMMMSENHTMPVTGLCDSNSGY
jgi:hypothetical protein